jgi:hypothetical protein
MLAVVSKIALSHSPLHKRAVASVPTYKKKLKIFVACGLGLEGELERELKELRILPNKCMLLVLQYSKVGIRQDGGLELKGELKGSSCSPTTNALQTFMLPTCCPILLLGCC